MTEFLFSVRKRLFMTKATLSQRFFVLPTLQGIKKNHL